MYVDTGLCKECGGQCCQTMAGMYAPADLLVLDFGVFLQYVQSLYIVIDAWEERGTTLMFFRPSTAKDTGLWAYSWNPSPCVHLTSDGCVLPRGKRPTQCLMLEPVFEDGEYACISHADSDDLVWEWEPYQAGFDELLNLFERSDINASQVG